MIEVTLPLRLYSHQNAIMHWRQRAKLAKAQRQAAHWGMRSEAILKGTTGPLTITITRIAPRRLDTDNLAISGKFVRDGIADWLERNDGDPLIDWQYAQESCKDYAVRIQVVA